MARCSLTQRYSPSSPPGSQSDMPTSIVPSLGRMPTRVKNPESVPGS